MAADFPGEERDLRFVPGDVTRTLPDWNQGAILCRGEEPHGHFNYIARPAGDRIPEKA